MAAPFPTRFLVDQITGSMVLATGVALTTAFYAYTRRVRAPYQKWFSAMQSIVPKNLPFAFFRILFARFRDLLYNARCAEGWGIGTASFAQALEV